MHDSDIEKNLISSLDKVSKTEIQTPDIRYFAKLVSAEKEKTAKKQKMQLTVFIVLSVFIVAAAILCLLRSLTVYLFLQGAAFAVFCVLIFWSMKKEASGL